MIGDLLLNRYQIVMRVGTGGMAIVYKAKDLVLNRYVAIKVLLPQFAHDEAFIKRFRREAQAAASLSHPNVVNVFDVGQDDDCHFIVMEYVEGKSLKELILEKAPLQADKAVNIGTQISDALIHAHKNQVIHRDIKPHNILITNDCKAKVTDFGIARAVTETTQTFTGSVMGSAHYFSPEQAKGSFTDASSDIYSLGIVLYEMLTSKVPFNGGSPISIALKHIQELPPRPTELNSEIPEELEMIIMKTLEKDQAIRYQNVRELLDDLNIFLEGYKGDVQLTSRSDRHHTYSFSFENSPTQKIPAVGSDYTSNSLEKDTEGDNRMQKTKGKKKTNTRVSAKRLAVLLTIFAVIGLGVFWSVNQLRAFLMVPEVNVPDVEGLSLSQAQREIEEQGLAYSVDEETPHPEIAANKVIYQEPEPDSVVRQNRTVYLTVSSGPEYVEIPDVRELRRREAIIKLERTGLSVEVDERHDDSPRGEVISQIPGHGNEVKQGTTVEIIVSKGGDPFILPSFVGKSLEAVESEIEELDLEIRHTHEDDDESIAKDHVTRQFPESGERVQPGDIVDIWVNKIEDDEDLEDDSDMEEMASQTVVVDELPIDREVRIIIDDDSGSNTAYEGIPNTDQKEFEANLAEGESGVVEVLVRQNEDGQFIPTRIFTFP